jgi:putative transposase
MALRFIYLAFCATLRLVARRRDDLEREAELLVLRQAVAILRRENARPRVRWSDRAFFAALARLIAPERRAGLIVTPATLLRWDRDPTSKRWRHSHRGSGRPSIASETRDLILLLAREKPLWGYSRPSGDAAKLAISVSPSSVRRVQLRDGADLARVPPCPHGGHPRARVPLRRLDSAAPRVRAVPEGPMKWRS